MGKIGNEGLVELLDRVDIIGFVETWVERELDLNIPGFQVVGNKWAKRRVNMGRAGGDISVSKG